MTGKKYPGRGLMLGRSPDGKNGVVAYFIMGRSTNSRNRVFAATEDGIRTAAFDESLLEDPSLIIYHPVRRLADGRMIVSNGDQTDTIQDYLLAGRTFAEALQGRTFEPDGPNWTPRISGVLGPRGGISLSILKTLNGDPDCGCWFFFDYDHPPAGHGLFLSTYVDDGEPLPSYSGEPVLVSIPETSPQQLAENLWQALNTENRVSLYVAWVRPDAKPETVIINANERNESNAGA